MYGRRLLFPTWVIAYINCDVCATRATSLRGEVYTPQMVVNGSMGFVGSDSKQALKAISNEARAPRATVRMQPISTSNRAESNTVSFFVQVEKLPALVENKKGLVFLAVTEDHLESSALRGENSGRTLAHTAVVRKLKMIGQVQASADATFLARPSVEVYQGWKRKDLRAVVFVQLQSTHQILGAAETPFPLP